MRTATSTAKTLNTEPLIMVVDDSLTVRKITSRMLIRAGYQVVTATDGVDALEKLEEFTPDVMLLDIEMPRMDGFALARELRRDPKDTESAYHHDYFPYRRQAPRLRDATGRQHLPGQALSGR